MPSATTQPLRAVVAVLGLALTIVVMLSIRSPPARAASPGQLQQQISAGQTHISGLRNAVGAASGRVSSLNSSLGTLERQIGSAQADLDAKRLELLKLRGQLGAARARLARLEGFEVRAEQILSRQLVSGYESDSPDIVSVVLEATGFNDLLERLAFAQQIRNQDVQVIGRVKAARRAVSAQATRLGALEVRQQSLTAEVLRERNSLDKSRFVLVSRQIAAIRARNAKAGELTAARGQVYGLEHQLAQLKAAQAAQAARAAAQAPAPSSQSGPSGASTPGSSSAGPSRTSSSGGFTFPLPKADVSPPSTWSLDDGVDMAAPGGTPEYAVCSGTIVLHGIGGFGPSAPVLHCDSPLDGYDYVYYGHAGPGNWTPVGAHVSAGQVISEIGYGIVGISTGPHVEMGFADSSGSPIGPSSAPQMLSLLQAAYRG
jgi:peptidoglycan hydrolase CwlO-like protein